MKKEYMEPQMEAIEIKAQQLLAGSITDFSGNGGFTGGGGGTGTGPSGGRAPLFDDPAWDALLDE